jgi:tetratricopeptide (TPR) repeat protein
MKKRIFLLATIMTLITVSAWGQSAKKYYNAGTEFVDNQKYDDAVVQFTSAIGMEPSNANYYAARAKAYEMLKKYNEAYADYQKSIVFSPKDVDVIISLGRVCNKLKKYDEALTHLNRAKDLSIRNPEAYSEKVITLYSMKKFDQALWASDTAILFRKDNAMNYYNRGLVYVGLNNDILAKKELEKSISKDKKLVEPRLELAKLFVRNNNIKEATDQINAVLAMDDKNTAAYIARSEIFKKNFDIPNTINDVSKAILIDPNNSEFYLIRGLDYQEFNQHANAISDFSKYISLNDKNPDAYYARAKSYEANQDFDKALTDYNKITELSKYDIRARELADAALARLYAINKENDPPEISIDAPAIKDNTILIKGNSNILTISGTLKEKSKLTSFKINNQNVLVGDRKNGVSDFVAKDIDVTGADKLTIVARDEYNNERNIDLKLNRTEIDPPKVIITVPPATEDGQVFLEDLKPTIYVEGKIEDASLIKSIEIGGVTAGFTASQNNPSFTVKLDVANINSFTVKAEDIYGNISETEFKLNRTNALLLESNPMGKTWVVFIENSGYQNFAALDGPIKDVSTMQRALANYQISMIIPKKDMKKAEMERFFNIELRDLLKANQVKSLLIWYSGHGKFINDVGYWIPVDASRDDEFTYFNINTLRAGMQAYSNLTHMLVVNDACESGPSFYSAMRSAGDDPACTDAKATAGKSAQVFSSAGRDLAADNSQFSQTFANSLITNKNSCIPIDAIVKSVSAAIESNNQQKPKFGNIAGFMVEGGTFFFIAK